jgi:hypothetical protein
MAASGTKRTWGEYVIEVIVDLDGKLENLPIELRVSVIFFE